MKPIRYLSLNLAPDVRVNSMLLCVRVMPDDRDGNVVYGRTQGWLEVVDGSGVEPSSGNAVRGSLGR